MPFSSRQHFSTFAATLLESSRQLCGVIAATKPRCGQLKSRKKNHFISVFMAFPLVEPSVNLATKSRCGISSAPPRTPEINFKTQRRSRNLLYFPGAGRGSQNLFLGCGAARGQVITKQICYIRRTHGTAGTSVPLSLIHI